MRAPFDWATPIATSGLTRNEVWLGYVANGGDMNCADLSDVVDGHRDAARREHNVLAQTLNEHLRSLDIHGSVPYRK